MTDSEEPLEMIRSIDPPKRTGWLTYVIVINWISVVLVTITGLILLTTSYEIFESGTDQQTRTLVGLFLLISAGLLAYLNIQIYRYNNKARIIVLILSTLSLLPGLTGNFFNLILYGLAVYALAFHKETIQSFKKFENAKIHNIDEKRK